jgi:hypothetical protein
VEIEGKMIIVTLFMTEDAEIMMEGPLGDQRWEDAGEASTSHYY